MAQASEQAPFISEIVGSILVTDSCEKSLPTLPKVVGFLRVLQVALTGQVGRVV